ncbi:C39 family peptidase [Hespellia stercorisuis]|uniref:Uncharacterized protein YvpB n=1 Tax=Hespellia stercorisuis DSM 15480 TaxID=1121950 RepID=A0A1M6PJQ8_9FIRM|nr:C39 family peptidase [Hespellia stercorisuis]SHK08186.1 Uncharacterized protein YvpB [Hespellia stercorisuis DSM 15480]
MRNSRWLNDHFKIILTVLTALVVILAVLNCWFVSYVESADGEAEKIVRETRENADGMQVEESERVSSDCIRTEASAQKIPDKVSLAVKSIDQLPELPTGCEAVSLTMLLQYYGFDDLEKTTIVDDYLEYSEDNFAEGYVGDPYSYEGAGCYAPGIATTANNYLTEEKATQKAFVISGADLEKLYNYIADGDPVLVWCTMGLGEALPTDSICEYEGREYTWYEGEHCVVLSGYDRKADTVWVNDPLEGLLEYDAGEFTKSYKALGEMAIVIK